MSTLTAPEAREAVSSALLGIVPDAELDLLGDQDPLRTELELDSLDFLAFVETLSQRCGVRIDEDDYPHLATMAGCVAFLTRVGG